MLVKSNHKYAVGIMSFILPGLNACIQMFSQRYNHCNIKIILFFNFNSSLNTNKINMETHHYQVQEICTLEEALDWLDLNLSE